MRKYDPALGLFYLEGGTPEEVAEMDRLHNRPDKSKELWSPNPKMRGAGDAIKRVTDALGIPQCGGCKDRQEKLNKLFPFRRGE